MGTSWENNDMEESLRKDTVAAEAETGDEENKAPACCCRTKVRTEKEQKDLINRLSRIEGQVRGIRRMLEEDAYWLRPMRRSTALPRSCLPTTFTHA